MGQALRLERIIINLRWVAGVVLLAQTLYVDHLSLENPWHFTPPVFVLLYNAVSFYVVNVTKLGRLRLAIVGELTTAFDILLITILVLGATTSLPEIYLGYVFVIIGAALRRGFQGAAVTAGAVCIVYTGTVVLSMPQALQPSFQAVLGRSLFFIVLSVGMGYLAQQLRREREKREELATLYETSRAASATLDLDSLLHLFLRSAVQQLGANHGVVFLLDEDRQRLQVKAAEGLNEEAARQRSFAIGEGAIGQVAETGQALLVRATRGKPATGKADGEEFLPMALAVPLVAKGMIIGVLGLGERASGEDYTETDLRLVATLAGHVSTSIENIRLYDNMENLALNTLRALAAAIDAKDQYTRGHSDRVAEYSLRLAERLRLRQSECETIHYAGILHDIGKIAVDEAILRKAGPLTPEERILMETHPVNGARIIEPIGFLKEAIPILRHHHERYEGGGYPDGLKGENIPVAARIVGVVDAWEAMTSDRPYRRGMSQQEAAEELRMNSGAQFDPELVELFLSILEKGKVR
ncbi:MAG: GAF domain-containing protein [Chloroflexi bacterium]|nr:GAF domain-containing protein [Chloroflexota bacterium]